MPSPSLIVHVARKAFSALLILGLSACASHSPLSTEDQITELTAAIVSLGPNVDPDEAARAARLAHTHAAQLAVEYQLADPPLIHNHKVNMGTKPRGLCWHWAEDMEARLKREAFRTLTIHRAIAEHVFGIDHSTAIISAKGDDFSQGIIVDPWRYGGALYWAPVAQDSNYAWRDRDVVLSERRDAMSSECEIPRSS